jgi:hypothetical protein
MKRFGPIIAVLLLGLLLPGCGKSKLSRVNYDKIKEGMSLREVEALLGKGMDITVPPNRPSSGSSVGAAAGIDMPSGTESGPALLPGIQRTGKVMQWGEDERVIQAVFIDDKVTVKQQKGL